MNSRRRFLIHNTVQEYFPGLTTVSVGHGEQRRTVVTFRNSAEDAQEATQHRSSKQEQEEQKEEEIEGERIGGKGGGGRRREAAAGATGSGSAGGCPEERLPKNEDRRDDATTKAAKLQHHQQCPQQKQAPPAQQQQHQQQQHSRGSQQHKGPQQQAEQRQQQQRKGSQQQLNNVGPQQQQQKQQVQEQQQQQQTSGKQRQRSRKARSRSCHSEPRNGGRQRQQQQQHQQKQQQQQQQGSSSGGGGPKHDERQVREDTPPEDTQSKKRRNRRNRKQRERQEQQQQNQQAENVNGRHEDEDERDNSVPYRAGHHHHRGGNHAFERRGAGQVRASGGESEWDLCARGVEGHVSESGGKANRVKTESESDKARNSSAGQGSGGGPHAFREDGGDLRLFLNSRREILAQSRSAEAPSASGKAASSNAAHDHHRMPVTMTSDDYSGSNSRPRGKACAQIYRPPPARSTRLDAGPVQQQQQQLYQPKQQQQHNQYYQHTQHSPQNNQYPQHQYPLSNRQRTDSESSYVMGDHQSGKAGRGRRPDQMLYVPRGRRNIDSGSVRGTPTPMQDYEQSQRAPSPTFSICSVVSEYSGRNRYSKHDSRHGSQLSIYDGDFDRIKSKPPLSKGEFSRESTPGNGRQKGGNRFNSQTLQLIERCLNQDSEPRLSDNRNWDSDSVHSSPAKNNRGGRGRNQKSPTPTRDIHSVHSKENVIHPVEPNSRTRKGRRNRRRNSRSREPSAEKYNDSRGSPGCNSKNGDPYNSPHSERGFGSCERVFYNSNFNSPGERYDRGYDNYDRYSSINNSRASSRNSSRERTPQHASYHTNWRGASSPSSPAKGYQNRNSPGKPPSGRLGSLPNVTLDYSENTRSPNPSNEENYRYHTLPVKHNRNPLMGSHRANSIDNSRISGVPNSHRLDQSYHDEPSYSSMETVDQGPSLLNGGSAEHRLENIKENPSFDSSYSSEQNTQMNRVEEMHVCEDISQGSACDTSSNGEVIEANQTTLPSDPAETDSSNGQPLHIVDNQSNAVSDELSSTAAGSSGKVYFDLGDEAEDPPEALAREAVAMENDTQNGIQAEAKEEASEQEKEEKKNLKKFSFNWADEVEDSWDTLYDDSGECLDPEIKRQLSDSIGKVKLVKPTNDYYDYQPKEPQINEDEYAHVIEIYDFPVSFKTQDLMMIFSPYQNNGFDIKWVDDTHALGIFATALIAKEALSIDHPFLKARSLSLATETSRSKAMRITEALLPYKPRPATSAALARRLVSGALGLKVNVPHEVREAERQKLKDAKAQKKLAAKQRSDAWEGTLT